MNFNKEAFALILENSGMTKAEFLRKMEEVGSRVSRQGVQYWINGRNIPNAMNLIKISEVLECDINHLIKGE